MRRNWMHRKEGERGSILLMVVMAISVVIIGLNYLAYRSTLDQKMFLSGIKENDQLLYLAEIGIGYGFAELRNHGYRWFTHTVDNNGYLQKNDSCSSPSLSGTSLGRRDNVYLVYSDPVKNQYVYVKTYQAPDGSIWIVSKAIYEGKEKVLRMALGTRSLYDYFDYYSKSHVFRSSQVYDGKGSGKIYVNGDIIFTGGVFRNIAELSTNSKGVFRVWRGQKSAPYCWDMGYYDGRCAEDPDHEVDGYAFLRTYANSHEREFGMDLNKYPSEFDSEKEFGPKYPWEIFRPLNNYFSSPPTFEFDPNVMPQELKEKIGLLAYSDVVKKRMPRRLYNDDGSPANWDYDFYRWDDKGTGRAQNETSLKFVRLYYVDDDGYAHIIGNPDRAPEGKQVYAQVYDKKYTPDETPVIHFLGRDIPVKESGIPFKFIADGGGEKVVRFDPEYERYYWDVGIGWRYGDFEDREDFIQNGYHRDSETVPVNYLNTAYLSQQNALRDWLEGRYNKGERSDENNTDLNLSWIIHEHATGAKDIQPPKIKTNFSNMALYGGIWIGYEGDNLKVCTGLDDDGNPKCKVYNSTEDLPEWISVSEFYSGSSPDGRSYSQMDLADPHWEYSEPRVTKLKVIDLDLEKAKDVLSNTNGVIWLEPTDDSNKYGYDGLRLKNGETIPRDGGITVVTPRNILVQGPLNKHDWESGDPLWQPTSLITDNYVIMLSKSFEDPKEPPAYSRFPHPGGNGQHWFLYLKYRFQQEPIRGEDSEGNPIEFNEDNFWPNYNDSEEVLIRKIYAIAEKVREYISKRHDADFCDIDMDTFMEEFYENPYAQDSLIEAINDAFSKRHHPDEGTGKKAMALNHDGDYYLGASVITGSWPGHGDGAIRFLENRGWWFTREYPDSDLVWKGTFISLDGSWSGRNYVRYRHGFGSLSWSPAKNYRVVENYGIIGMYPPGDLSGGSKSIWYIDPDSSSFDKHPYLVS